MMKQLMKQFKLGMKLLKYGYGFKMNLILGGVIVLLGIFIEICFTNIVNRVGSISNINSPTIGGFYICLIGMFLVQTLMSLNSTGCVLSSPHRKGLLCTIPTTIYGVFLFLGFSLNLVIRPILRVFCPCEWSDISRELYTLTALLFLVSFFTTFAYRYFVLSLILFTLTFFGFYSIGGTFLYHLQAEYADSIFFTMPVTIAICYCTLLLSILINWLCSNRIYKKPISKLAQGAALRKYL